MHECGFSFHYTFKRIDILFYIAISCIWGLTKFQFKFWQSSGPAISSSQLCYYRKPCLRCTETCCVQGLNCGVI